MRHWLGRLGLVVASIAICLILGELTLRALYGRPRGSTGEDSDFDVYRPDAELGYALRPSWEAVHASSDFRVTVRTNALGMRGKAIASEKAPNSRRILVLGDSFAFGFGVEDDETLPARLAARLAAVAAPRVEVVNAAVPGYSADHHLLVFSRLAARLSPDLLIMAVCNNDVDDLGWSRHTFGPDRLPERIESFRRFIDHRGRMRYLNESRVLPAAGLPAPRLLVDHSLLHRWLRVRLERARIASAMRRHRQTREKRNERPGPAPRPGVEIAALDTEEIARGLTSDDAFRHRYHRFLLAALEARARERGIAVRTVVTGKPGGRLSDHCRLAGASRCLDASLLFPRGTDPASYHSIDGHWSARGNDRVAGALAAWLVGDAKIDWLHQP